jgi:hypothetical protein
MLEHLASLDFETLAEGVSVLALIFLSRPCVRSGSFRNS